MTYQFPFGRPVEACAPSRHHGGLFVLGAYPSALHVHWAAPDGTEIAALAVDNEPEPFWNGADEEARIAKWKEQVGFGDRWGSVGPVGKHNGSSGAWLDVNVIAPLGFRREQTWITDCLDTYRASTAQARAIDERFRPFAGSTGIEPPSLPKHPSESAIVKEARAEHLDRLGRELRDAGPTTIVTLGNAALRIMQMLLDHDPYGDDRLYQEPYGRRLVSSIEGRFVAWYPLVHPGARGWRWAHGAWVRLRSGGAIAARRRCPRCQARGLVRIVYGMPAGEIVEQARLGRVAIGGCTIFADDPELECVECGVQVWADGRTADPEPW
jgi:hypothetical protein